VATLCSDRIVFVRGGASADRAHGRQSAQMRWRRTIAALSSPLVIAALAITLAPASAADATANLESTVNAARGACPPLQPDAVLYGVAQRANNETHSYIEYNARFEPFEDPMPVLRELGYNAGKAKLVVGNGDTEAKAIHGVIVLGWEAIPDCSYTKYGLNALSDTDAGYTLTALVLAGD
jgi:hypothetical protein